MLIERHTLGSAQFFPMLDARKDNSWIHHTFIQGLGDLAFFSS